MTTALHDDRLAAVHAAVVAAGAARVLELGCGDGALLLRLAADPAIRKVIGLDIDAGSLRMARQRLDRLEEGVREKVELAQGSMLDLRRPFPEIDMIVMAESIEHIEPDNLSALEHVLFRRLRPRATIVTTPNADYNALLGVPPTRFRHPGHKFEWGREKFESWAQGVAARNGYAVTLSDIGGQHPQLGGASQMAVFTSARAASVL